MKNKTLQRRNTLFFTLIALFIILFASFSLQITDIEISFSIIAILAFIASLLGILLIVFTLHLKEDKKHKFFFILTGASIIGIPIFAILHNLVYGLFIYFFGADFWNRTASGGDEAFFFILALLVCPICFIIGAVGSVVVLLKDKKRAAE